MKISFLFASITSSTAIGQLKMLKSTFIIMKNNTRGKCQNKSDPKIKPWGSPKVCLYIVCTNVHTEGNQTLLISLKAKPKRNDECQDKMLCTIWYYLYNLKNMKNAHGGEKWQVFVPIYVAFMSPIYHFHFHFPYNQSYNLIETDFLHNFYNISYYFCLVTWIKKTSIFSIAKNQFQGVA